MQATDSIAGGATDDRDARELLAVIVGGYLPAVEGEPLVTALHVVLGPADELSTALAAQLDRDWPDKVAALDDSALDDLLSAARGRAHR